MSPHAHFIDEPIQVIYREPPILIKTPSCPDAFIWRDEEYPVLEMLEVWQDFRRRGRSAHNMRPSHLTAAALRGSWGVGRFHFRVRVAGDRIFELYYDRAPQSANDRAGSWFLLSERTPSES